MRSNRLIFLFVFLLVRLSVAQNSQIVSGVIKDATSGEVLAGATVLETTTKRGVSANLDGMFTLNLNKEINKKYFLKVSFIGYETKVVEITSKKNYEIFLQEEENILDEVVITSSYGTKKLKQEVVGSISTITTKEIIKEQPAVSFEELLEGQIAGLNIEINPELGEAVAIDIRGQGSITPLNNNSVSTSTQPLIIVDGIIMSEETGIDGNNFFDQGDGVLSENFLNPLSKINVNDIESINVLKDAAAVGLYGADGANGVIIITTKSGEIGGLQFTSSIQGGVSNAFNEFKYLSGEQYQNVVNQFYTNSGELQNVQIWNGVDTNWFDVLNGVGTFQRYNLSGQGGTKKFNYRVNVGYQFNDEAQIQNDYKKLNSTIALEYSNNRFNASVRISPSLVIKNNPNTLYSFALPPTLSPYDENGNYTPFDTYGNPLAVANQNKSSAETLGFLNSLNLSYAISDKLKISSLFGMDFSNKEEDKFFSGLNGSGQFNDGDLGRRLKRSRNTKKWNWNSSLFYENTFHEKHNFDAIAGIEIRSENTYLTQSRGDGFEDFTIPQAISSANDQDYNEDSSVNKGVSFFSQYNYNFDKRYFLLANFRIDKSSVFGSDNNTAVNGGLGASWNISNENFFNSKNINFLRLRASYGSTGNSRIGSYRALGLYTVIESAYNNLTSSNITSLPNTYLGWEKNFKFNIGLDINFLDKFSLTAEIFNDDIRDMITTRNVIVEAGLSSLQINGADMYNRGLELSFNANWFTNDNFSWTTSATYSKIENKVTNLVGLGSEFSAAETARAQKIGFSTSTLWGFDFEGIDPATGTELYNVDGQIYDAAYVSENFDATNWKPIGDSQPDFFGGLNNRFKYKNFNANIVLSYTWGADEFLARELLDNYNVLFNRNISANIYTEAWQQQGDQANYQAITKYRNIISNSSKYIFDTSHIKLKAINFGYNFPTEKMNTPFTSLNIFLNGSNLWYWFKNASEEGKNGVAEYRNTYPEMRTISLGINASF